MQTYNMPSDPIVRLALENQAMERVLKARHEIILTHAFYAVLISHVEPMMAWDVDTAATNGRVHFWNPAFVGTLTQAELVAVQVHESEHDARHHSTRRNGRAMFDWNVACDYAINVDITAEGFTLPKCALLDKRYATMSAEEIYRTLELEKPKEPEQPEQPQQEQPEQEQDTEQADTNPGNQTEQGDDTDEQGDEQGNDGDAGSDDADSDEQSTEGQGGDQGGDEQGEQPGEGDGQGAGEDDGEGTGTGTGDAEEGEAQEAGKGGNDPGQCGGVLDAPEGDDDNAAADLDHEWEKVVRQAAGMAKAAGQLPGHVSREIERANNPVRAWRDELREFAEQGALRIETWNRPNRRFASQGIYLPSTIKDGVSKAAFLIDTSGSCDEKALACVQDEAQQLMDDGVIDEIVVVYGDTQVTRVDEYTTGDTIEFDPRGGGGTDMQPLFNYVAEEHSDATLIINFTDLDFYRELGDEPSVPVLFAVHGVPERVKAHMANTPWNARAIDVGVH